MPFRRLFPLAGLLLFAGCVSGSDIESLRAQLTDLQRQVQTLQAQNASKQDVAQLATAAQQQSDRLMKAEADQKADVGDLSSELRELQGKLDDTNFRISQLSQQIASANQDLKAVRGTTVPGGAAPSPGSPGNSAAAAPAGTAADPETLYQTAYSDYLRGAYDLALLGFRQYLEAYPDTDLADNAVYWTGESYYRQQHYTEAIAEYDRVLQQWPRSDKTASAILKKGYAQLELGKKQDAIQQLQKVVQSFPNSDEANLARQKLQSLGVASGKQR